MHRVGLLVYPGFQSLALAVATAFEYANLMNGEPAYDFRLVSEDGGAVACSQGFSVHTDAWGRKAFDTLIVAGDNECRMPSATLIARVRKAAGRSRRIASICTGAFSLAQAGVLDGRRATTHWMFAREMAARHPAVTVEDDRIYVNDGPVWTSAGMTAGLDLALALVEADRGAEVARQIARALVMYHRRAGGQSQFSTLLEIAPKSDRIQRALSHAKQNLKDALSVEELARAAALSPRQFSRLFHSETGQTPAKAVENLRLEAARLMMEEGSHPVEVIAHETGFADRERMRRAFVRAFGQPPQAIRRGARAMAVS